MGGDLFSDAKGGRREGEMQFRRVCVGELEVAFPLEADPLGLKSFLSDGVG